jgi:hypothetical protein
MTTQHIQLRRGTAADLPDGGTIEGEPRFTIDTGRLYIDDGSDNVLIGGKGSYAVIGSFNRAMDAATGDVTYTEVGFQPSHIIFIAHLTTSMSVGFDDGTNHYVIVHHESSTYENSGVQSISIFETTGKKQTAIVKTLNADGFTLTWTRTGETASATAHIYYMAFR